MMQENETTLSERMPNLDLKINFRQKYFSTQARQKILKCDVWTYKRQLAKKSWG